MQLVRGGPSERHAIRGLRIRFLVVLGVLAVFLVSAYVVVHASIDRSVDRARHVREAARQESRFQRLAELARELVVVSSGQAGAETGADARSQLVRDLSLLTSEIAAVDEGLRALAIPDLTRALALEGAADAVSLPMYIAAARRLAARGAAEISATDEDLVRVTDRKTIDAHAAAGLRAAEAAEEDMRRDAAASARSEAILVALGIAALFLLGVAAIEPVLRRIRREFERLRESGLYMRTVVDTASDGIVTVDEKGIVESFNPAAERIFGHEEHDATGFRFELLIAELSLGDAARLGGEHEVLGRRRDGSDIHLEVGVARTSFDGREVFICSVRDVTARVEAKEELRQSDAQKSAIVAAALEPIVSLDASGRIRALNPSAERALGWKANEIEGRELAEVLIPRPDRANVRRGLVAAVESGVASDLVPTHILRKDGTEIPAEITLGVFGVAGERVVTAFVRDLSDRARAEASARAEGQRTFAALEVVPDAVMSLEGSPSSALAIRSMNAAGERLFGWSRAELTARAAHDLVAETDRTQFEDLVRAARSRSDGAAATGEFVAVRRDGSRFPAQFLLARHVEEEREVLLGVVRDISARRQADQQLKERALELARSNAELEQFAYVAAHDLQEPLRMVASYTELLGKRYRGQIDQDADEFIGFAVDGAKRMQYLINDLLNYSRVGTRAAAFEPTNLSAIVNEVLRTLRLAIEQSEARVEVAPLPVVSADARQMTQLFQNLISNALKFRGENPPVISIHALRAGDRWRVAVRDNGIGLDMEYAERIFVVFQRLHGRDKYPGTGVGLAICKKIVERHGGTIAVASAPGEGSEFHFTLPAERGRKVEG